MFEIIKSVIKNKNFELKDMLYKINKMWIESAITEEQKNELDALARENAVAENSYTPLQEQIENIYNELANINSRLDKLEGQEEPIEPEEPTETDEYPEFVQPTGAHDCYNTGMKTTFNGEKYICKIDGCVWDPITYPNAWEKVIEETEDDQESEVKE